MEKVVHDAAVKVRMEYARYSKFLQAVLPLITRLADEWFPPDKKTPDGQYYYACTYCDMGCGRHESHDEDCWSEISKNVLVAFEKIDADPKFDTSPITKEARDPKDSRELREWSKAREVLKRLYGPNLLSVIPMDYSDPENHNVICTCHLFSDKRELKRHEVDCLHQILAKALIELMTVNEP